MLNFETIKRAIAEDERRERIENESDDLRAAVRTLEDCGVYPKSVADDFRAAIEGDIDAFARVCRRNQTGPQGEALFLN